MALPATVVTRTALLPLSAIKTLPAQSAATPIGLLKSAAVATPSANAATVPKMPPPPASVVTLYAPAVSASVRTLLADLSPT